MSDTVVRVEVKPMMVRVEPSAAHVIEIKPVGMQGGQGPQGVSQRFDHTQASPSSTWTINHNFGYQVSTTVFSVGGLEIEAEVLNVSLNQVQILFVTPTAGSAVIT